MRWFLLYPAVTLAFPVQNTTQPEQVGWQSAPNVRGTFDLLISCLVTLSLCAWTAYHPNVFETKSEWKRFTKRIVWMGIAVLAPEVVLWCAWDQWWVCKKLKEAVDRMGEKAFDGCGGIQENDESECEGCDRLEDEERSLQDYGLDLLFEQGEAGAGGSQIDAMSSDAPTQPTNRRFRLPKLRLGKRKKDLEKLQKEGQKRVDTWTKEQAFFAVSGGFAVDASSFYPLPTLTLTPPALHFLARLGLLPKISAATVSDKSKADYAAKVLVCIQAGWFLVQCIARLAQRLPLTLLELHVLAHVGCAFGMYVLWIEKPYDVGAPILVQDKRVVDLVAFWALDDASRSYQPHNAGDAYRCAKNGSLAVEPVKTAHDNVRSLSSRERYLASVKSYLELDKRNSRTSNLEASTLESKHPEQSATTARHIAHLTRANDALAYLKSRDVHFPYLSKARAIAPGCTPSIRLPTRHVVPTRSNLIIDGLASISKDDNRADRFIAAVKTYAVMSTLYGALHLAGWQFRFATHIEAWFWRGSGLVMVTTPLAAVVAIESMNISVWCNNALRNANEDRGGRNMSLVSTAQRSVKLLFSRGWYRFASVAAAALWYPSFLVAMLALAMYPVARLYVLAGSFASLRSSDPSVYKTVEWTDFIPHAG